MKIYIASAHCFKEQCEGLDLWLTKHGHEVTCRWWFTDYKKSLGIQDEETWYANPITKVISQRSLKAIDSADLIILLSPEVHKFTGANIELGYALKCGKPTIAFGEVERSALYESLVRLNYGDLKLLEKILGEYAK